MQDDVQMARDEINSLMRQRDEWTDLKGTLEQTIEDYKYQAQQHEEQRQQQLADTQRREEEVRQLQSQLQEAAQREQDRTQQIASLEAELQNLRDNETQLNDTLRKTRVALTREKSRLEMYQNATTAGTTTASFSAGTSVRLTESSNPATVQEEEPEPEAPQPQVRLDSPYILQQEVLPLVTPGAQVTDLDDDDAPPAVMRTLVPTVTRQAEIEAVHATYTTDDTR